MESSQKNSMLLSMERYVQLKNILSNVKIPYAVIKGEPLSILCYNKKGVRNSQDIDILAERRYGEVVGFLNAAGLVLFGSAFQNQGKQLLGIYFTLIHHLIDFVGQSGCLYGQAITWNRYLLYVLRSTTNCE